MVDLKKFCGTDTWRTYLHEPFSRGEYTYATNGAIIVRVPLVAEIGEDPRTPNPEKIFAPMPADGWRPLRVALPTVAQTEVCGSCYRGFEHDCPDCTCVCDECGGSGEVEQKFSTDIGGVIFDVKYIRMIAELPGVEICVTDGKSPTFFRFDGGVGALMPMRSRLENHIDATRSVEVKL